MVCYILYSVEVDLRYWREIFIYAVYIRSLTPISRLKRVVSYEIWTERKPDVSYLQIFKALGWAHISKKVWKEKLKSRAVKV